MQPRGRRPLQPRGRRPLQPRGRRPLQPRGRRPLQPRGRRTLQVRCWSSKGLMVLCAVNLSALLAYRKVTSSNRLCSHHGYTLKNACGRRAPCRSLPVLERIASVWHRLTSRLGGIIVLHSGPPLLHGICCTISRGGLLVCCLGRRVLIGS